MPAAGVRPVPQTSTFDAAVISVFLSIIGLFGTIFLDERRNV
jgi:hypothetical protein